jgi:putative ABC transport system permease protein
MARLKALDGQPVEKLAEGAKENKQWTLTREQRLTYLDRLAEDNEIVAGQGLGVHGASAKELFVKPDVAEVSLERDFAKDLGAKVGSVLTFDVQGVPLDLTVTSIRAVNWKTFGINFFFVVEPGVLEDAPQTRLAAAPVPQDPEDALRSALARTFPNITLVPVREVLEKIAALLGRLGGAVRFLGGFTVLAGIVILAGAVGATSSRRGREVALLKTLGLSRASVSGIFAAEYALIGTWPRASRSSRPSRCRTRSPSRSSSCRLRGRQGRFSWPRFRPSSRWEPGSSRASGRSGRPIGPSAPTDEGRAGR